MTPLLTQQQEIALYNRLTTVRELAQELGVSANKLFKLYPGRAAPESGRKTELIAARKEYRQLLARQVLSGTLGLNDASVTACCSVKTMRRAVFAVKLSNE